MGIAISGYDVIRLKHRAACHLWDQNFFGKKNLFCQVKIAAGLVYMGNEKETDK